MQLACTIFGHRYRFASENATMTWACDRGCAVGGSKAYATPEQARKMAAALDREDHADLGRRAPILGMFPLRVVRNLRQRATRRDAPDRQNGHE